MAKKKKKRINSRIFILLSVLAAIGIGLGVYMWFTSMPKDPAPLLAQAEKAMTEDPPNFAKAESAYADAVKASEGSKEETKYQYEFAKFTVRRLKEDNSLSPSQRTREQDRYQDLLKKIIRTDPAHIAARKDWADILWAMSQGGNNSKTSKSLIKELDTILKLDKDASLFYRRSVTKHKLGKTEIDLYAQALPDIREAIQLDKTNLNYWFTLAEMQLKRDLEEEAKATYLAAIEANPNKAIARVVYAKKFLLPRKLQADAIRVIQEAIQCEPDSADGLLALTEIRLANGELDQAEALLQQALEADNKDPNIYRQIALLAQHRNDIPKAIQALEQGLVAMKSAVPDTVDKRTLYSLNRSIAQLNYWLADMWIGLYSRVTKPEEKANALAKAQAYHRVLLTTSPKDPWQWNIAGRIAMAKGDWDQARQDFEISNQYSNNRMDFQTLWSLVLVYRRLGMPSRAEGLVNSLLQNSAYSNNIGLLLQRVSLRMKVGDLATARQTLSRVLAQQSDNLQARNLQVALQLAEGRVMALPQTLKWNSVLQAAALRKVESWTFNEQYDHAIAYLQKVIVLAPDDIIIRQTLLNLLLRQDRKPEANALLQEALKRNPDSQDLKTWVAAIQESDPEKRFDIEIKAADQETEPLRKELRKYRICKRYRKSEQAENYLRSAEKIDPKNKIVVEGLFSLALSQGKPGEALAEDYIKRIRETDPIEATAMEARLATSRKEYEKAAALYEDILEKRPQFQSARLALAFCYFAQNDFEQAEKQFEICHRNDVRNINAMVGLAQVAEQQQKFSERDQWVKTAYEAFPEARVHPYIQRIYVQQEVDRTDPKKAISLREATFRRDANNLENARRLGWLYLQKKMTDKALAKFEYVYQKVPNKIGFSMELARAYHLAGESTKAGPLFDQLLKTNTAPADRARIYVNRGHFLSAVEPQAPKAAKAMYEEAIKADPKNPMGYVAIANLFATQAQRLQQQGQFEASRAKWNDSVQTLERVLVIAPDDTVRIAIARRRIDAGDYDRAIRDFEALLQTSPDNAQARVGLALAYIQQQKWALAQENLTRAIELNPQLSEAFRLRAMVNRADLDLASSATDLKKAIKVAQNKESLRLTLAKTYEDMNQLDNAGQQYSLILAANPQSFSAYMGLIRLFGEQKKYTNMQQIADKALKQFPKAPPLLLRLAHYAEKQGKRAEMISYLEKALEAARDQRDVIHAYFRGMAKAGSQERMKAMAKSYLQDPKEKAVVEAFLAWAITRRDRASVAGKAQFLRAMQGATGNELFIISELLRDVYKPGERVALLEKVGQPEPTPVYYAILGDAYMNLSNYNRAKAIYLKGLDQCKTIANRVLLLSRLATFYEVIPDQQDLLEQTYLRILREMPNNIQALNNLSYLYADKMGKSKKALPLIQRALRFRAGDPNLMDTYAWILLKNGEPQRAEAILEDVLKRSELRVDPLYHMGVVQEKLEKWEKAKGFFRRAIETIHNKKAHPLHAKLQAALARVDAKISQ